MPQSIRSESHGRFRVLEVFVAFVFVAPVVPEDVCDAELRDARNRSAAATSGQVCGLGKYMVEVEQCGISSFHCADCPKGFYSDSKEIGYCYTCPKGKFANQKAQSACDDCPLGTTSDAGESMCRLCDAGTRRERQDTAVCEPCPPGSDCTKPGTARPSNLENYWLRIDPATNISTFLPCFIDGECLVGRGCAPGSVGTLCAVCLPGYVRTVNGCRECPSAFSTVFCLCAAGLGLLLAVYFIASKNAKSAGKKKSLVSSLIKLFLGYLTTVSVVFPIFADVAIQEHRQYLIDASEGRQRDYDERVVAVGQMMEMLSIFSWLDYLSGLVSPACLVEPVLSPDQKQLIDSLAGLGHSVEPLVAAATALYDHHWYWELYMLSTSLLAPVLVIVIGIFFGFIVVCVVLYSRRDFLRHAFEFYERVREVGGFASAAEEFSLHEVETYLLLYTERWLGIWSLTRLWRARRRPCVFLWEFLRDAAPLYVVSTFFLYPFMVRASLRPIRCVELSGDIRFAPKPADLRIETSADVLCQDKGGTMWWISGVTMPVFAVCVQGVLFLLLQLNAADAHNARVQRTWNFLTAGYEIDRRSWECLAAMRKAFSIFVSVLFVRPSMKFNGLLVLAFTFTTLHIIFSPYENSHDELLDKIERLHLIIWVVSVVLGVASTDPTWGSSGLALLLSMSIVILLHGLFVLYWIYTFFSIATNDFVDRLLADSKVGGLLYGKFDLTEYEATAGGLGKMPKTLSRTPGQHVGFAQRAYVSVVTGPLRCLSQKLLSEVCHMRGTEVRITYDVENRMFVVLRGKFEGRSCEKSKNKVDLLLEYGPQVCGQWHMSESDRRSALAVVMEAFEYVIVNLSFCTISCSLLEFVLRYGFAFGAHGSYQEATVDHVFSDCSGTVRHFGLAEEGVKIAKHLENDAIHKRINGSTVCDSEYEMKCMRAVRWMLDDSVFEHSLTVAELQDNLSSLMLKSASEVQVWLNVFEYLQRKRYCDRPESAWASSASQPYHSFHQLASVTSESQPPLTSATSEAQLPQQCREEPVVLSSASSERNQHHQEACGAGIGELNSGAVSTAPLPQRCCKVGNAAIQVDLQRAFDEVLSAAWNRMVTGAIGITSRQGVWAAQRRARDVQESKGFVFVRPKEKVHLQGDAIVQELESCASKAVSLESVQLANARDLLAENTIAQDTDEALGQQVEPCPVKSLPRDGVRSAETRAFFGDTSVHRDTPGLGWINVLGFPSRKPHSSNSCEPEETPGVVPKQDHLNDIRLSLTHWELPQNGPIPLMSTHLRRCEPKAPQRMVPKPDMEIGRSLVHQEEVLPYRYSDPIPSIGTDAVRARLNQARETDEETAPIYSIKGFQPRASLESEILNGDLPNAGLAKQFVVTRRRSR